MAATREPRVRNTGASLLSHALAVIGAGGALAGWVAIVGGVREYARFRAAGIPSPAQTASLFPRDALLGEGLSVLLRMLLVCVPASGVAYMAVRSYMSPAPYDPYRAIAQRAYRAGKDSSRIKARLAKVRAQLARLLHRDPRDELLANQRRWPWNERRIVGCIVSAITLTGCVVLWHRFAFGGWQTGTAVVLVPVTGLLFGLGWLEGPGAAALAVFVSLILNGGVTAFMQQLEARNGDFDSVIVQRRGLETVSGFYLTRSGGDVYVVVHPAELGGKSTYREKFAIIAIPESQVETIYIGPDFHLHKGKIERHEHLAITKIPKPAGKHIFPFYSGSPEPSEPKSGNTTNSSTASTTISTTTNHNTATTTNTTTNIINENEEPTVAATQPVVQLYGASDLVLVDNHFCFPVTAANTRETIGLVFTAPSLGREGEDFAHEQVNVGPRGNKGVPIWLKGSLLRQIRQDAPVLINVKISAETDSGGETTVADRVLLYGPGEAAPGRAHHQGQTYGPKCLF